MPGTKLSNEYQRAFEKLYAKTPKAVFAAIAFSMCFIDMQEAGNSAAIARFREEWQALYDNGIVPQKPPKESAHA